MRTHTRWVSVADVGADDEEHVAFGQEDVKFLKEGWEEKERVIETVAESEGSGLRGRFGGW